MSDIKLTCDETPLKWPASAALTDLTITTTSSLIVNAPQSGTLQVLTRRLAGGVGDGVNIEESESVGADYRGQRFSLDEAILHVPGLHVFPGQSAVYPAEYHIHLKTFTAPYRFITIVLPVSHKATDLSGGGTDTEAYFAAATAQPDPNATRPALTTLFQGSPDVLQYQGPDLRGRTADTSGGCQTVNADAIRQFLLVLQVARIRASDLERIPREGSLSTVPRDMPALGVTPLRTVTKDRFVRVVTLARPGLGSRSDPGAPPPPPGPVECAPLGSSKGKTVLKDTSGNAVDVTVLLGPGSGSGGSDAGATGTATATEATVEYYLTVFLSSIAMFAGLYLADYWIGRYVWAWFFSGMLKPEPIKIYLFIFLAIVLSAAIPSGL